MEIVVAHSPAIPQSESWILRVLHSAKEEATYDETAVHAEGIMVSPSLNIERTDGMVAEFKQPDELLEHTLYRAHQLGKGVLIFLPFGRDPNYFLPSFAPHPFNETEKKFPRAYWLNRTDEVGNEVAIHAAGYGDMKLKIWLGSQLMRIGGTQRLLETQFAESPLEDEAQTIPGLED